MNAPRKSFDSLLGSFKQQPSFHIS
jgi:hypothetical protein